MTVFKIHEDSLQERFQNSRSKIQLFGGGFANGKTANACIKALKLAKDYPGSNGLMARSTYPKLNDTLRKEFIKWCPKDWVQSFPKSQNASNTCTLTNGTTINFRYIAQQGKSTGEATTSNLLSATYDWIVVDQMEDPEIVHKDFLDLLGRLRGMTTYRGDDPTMPVTGPRYFILTTNPTRNWVYKKLVKPVHDLSPVHYSTKKPKKVVINDNLLCKTDKEGRVILDENNLPTPTIEVYEGSTYENEENLEPDFIETLESAYKGQMRERFLKGNWGAYEGLVYPQFNEDVHVMQHQDILDYFYQLKMQVEDMIYLEGYDYGLAVPFCYMCGFDDNFGNVFLLDGEYQSELSPEDQAVLINSKRKDYGIPINNHVWSDPSIFRRSPGAKKLVGMSVGAMLLEDGIYCTPGNNAIANGIVKVGQYLNIHMHHKNPITGKWNLSLKALTFMQTYDLIKDNIQSLDEAIDYIEKEWTDGITSGVRDNRRKPNNSSTKTP